MKPNVRTYTALITALGNAKQWKRAMKTLAAMKGDRSGNMEPNAYTYSALLKALGEHGQWGIAERVSVFQCLKLWAPDSTGCTLSCFRSVQSAQLTLVSQHGCNLQS